MTRVESIEPRLTPPRAVAPATAGEALQEWCRDLEQELCARLGLLSEDELRWQPHPDANGAGVTIWHVARWMDVLGTRLLAGRPAGQDLWHADGWRDRTGYEPDGLGYLGLGTLTGYTPAQMRAVPHLSGASLSRYLSRSITGLVEQIAHLGPRLHDTTHRDLSPYQVVSGTLQGSFGHLGEIDALVALRARLAEGRDRRP